MAGDSSPDYKALFLQAEERNRRTTFEVLQAEELRRQAEDRQRKAKDRQKQAEERNRRTTFEEFIRACHNLLSLPVGVGDPTRCTKGSLKNPAGKICPTRLRLWADCGDSQQQLYNSVRISYMHPRKMHPGCFQLENDVESYERTAVEEYVHDVIAELCKISEAQKELHGVQFDNHANALDDIYSAVPDVEDPSSIRRPNPDQFCIHRVNSNTKTLLTSAEYKPPHKLSVEHLRAGLKPMHFWDEVVQRETTPTYGNEKLRYWAEQQTGSVLVQTIPCHGP
ncbi:hypothetical protein V1515DRAFT_581692 [Lipomyces mesembrius]